MTPLSLSVPKERLEDSTLREVCEHHRLTEADIRGNSRRPEVVAARRDWWATLWASGWGFSQIARATGRDHTSIMEAARAEGWGR